ncbi:hypothetical protein HZ500_005488 [Salmonella enterica]|nr:hypothetical protein [Salmonella enterica]
MKLPELWPLYAKWFVVWLVILPMILHRVGCSGIPSSTLICYVSVGIGFGLCVPLVDRVFFFLCQFWKN